MEQLKIHNYDLLHGTDTGNSGASNSGGRQGTTATDYHFHPSKSTSVSTSTSTSTSSSKVFCTVDDIVGTLGLPSAHSFFAICDKDRGDNDDDEMIAMG